MKTNKKSIKITAVIFLVLACLFLLVSIIMFTFGFVTMSEGEKLEAKIITLYEEKTEIEYKINNEVFTTVLNESSDFYYVDKIISVYYFNNKVYSFSLLLIIPIILLSVGLCLIIFPIIYFIKQNKIKYFNENKHLFDKRIAKVIEVKVNRNFEVNGTHPYYLLCEVKINGEIIKVKSEDIWEKIEYQSNYIVDVYFQTRKKYYVDLDSYRSNDF